MPKARQSYDDEVDLFVFFETLWDGKGKIVATIFVTALLSIVLYYAQPNLYTVSTSIKPANQSVFIPFVQLNEILNRTKINFQIGNKH